MARGPDMADGKKQVGGFEVTTFTKYRRQTRCGKKN